MDRRPLPFVYREDRLADEGLAGRLVARLDSLGFGGLSERQKKQQPAKLDARLKVAEVEAREARRAEAIRELEEQYAAEATA